nr:MAG TPA: hypothetical protein [Caudoviricetes sp.]
MCIIQPASAREALCGVSGSPKKSRSAESRNLRHRKRYRV